MDLVVSKFDEINNIFHIFNCETAEIWKLTGGNTDCGILLETFVDSTPGLWRLDLLKSLFPEVYTGVAPGASHFDSIRELPQTDIGLFSSFEFERLDPSPFYISMANKVKRSHGIENCNGEKVLFVERKGDRILYDFHTKRLLSEVLLEAFAGSTIPFEVVDFDDASFKYQLNAVSNAKILLACHGAANTNLFLMPKDGALFEINFRRFWSCDPVCEGHKSGAIPYTTNCDGPLTYAPSFHKADYYNLSQLFGIQYKEFEVEDAENFMNDNPIVLEKIYVDAPSLEREIRKTFSQ